MINIKINITIIIFYLKHIVLVIKVWLWLRIENWSIRMRIWSALWCLEMIWLILVNWLLIVALKLITLVAILKNSAILLLNLVWILINVEAIEMIALLLECIIIIIRNLLAVMVGNLLLGILKRLRIEILRILVHRLELVRKAILVVIVFEIHFYLFFAIY